MECKYSCHSVPRSSLIQLFRFRWVFCQLETLRRCFPPSIRCLLGELPTTLDETYERILMEIPEEKWEHAHRLFQCLIVSSTLHFCSYLFYYLF
jgi:hypothetical protein